MILEERDSGGGGGVVVKEITKNGDSDNGASFSAWKSGVVAPGDVLQRINDVDVSQSDFEQVMALLVNKDKDSSDSSGDNSGPLKLVFSDGLGQLDMPKNVLQQLKSSDDAFLIDAVVRQAVREIRRDGRLGDLRNVEVVVGAGVQQQKQDGRRKDPRRKPKRGLARFFAIFSTDNVTTYSCNCAATGIKIEDIEDNDNDNDNGNDDNNGSNDGRPIQVRIVSLSCAKDEGLGRTYDLIQEEDD